MHSILIVLRLLNIYSYINKLLERKFLNIKYGILHSVKAFKIIIIHSISGHDLRHNKVGKGNNVRRIDIKKKKMFKIRNLVGII